MLVIRISVRIVKNTISALKLGAVRRTTDGVGVRNSGRRRRSGASQSSTVLIM